MNENFRYLARKPTAAVKKLIFVLGAFGLLSASLGAFLKIMHWPYSDVLLLASIPASVGFWGLLLYFLLFRVGRRVG